MVRIEGPDEYDRLDGLVRRLAESHGLRLDVVGWTRKTYDLYAPTVHGKPGPLLARVESFATTNGEVVVFDDRAVAFATELAGELEREFAIAEAAVVRRPRA